MLGPAAIATLVQAPTAHQDDNVCWIFPILQCSVVLCVYCPSRSWGMSQHIKYVPVLAKRHVKMLSGI